MAEESDLLAEMGCTLQQFHEDFIRHLEMLNIAQCGIEDEGATERAKTAKDVLLREVKQVYDISKEMGERLCVEVTVPSVIAELPSTPINNADAEVPPTPKHLLEGSASSTPLSSALASPLNPTPPHFDFDTTTRPPASDAELADLPLPPGSDEDHTDLLSRSDFDEDVTNVRSSSGSREDLTYAPTPSTALIHTPSPSSPPVGLWPTGAGAGGDEEVPDFLISSRIQGFKLPVVKGGKKRQRAGKTTAPKTTLATKATKGPASTTQESNSDGQHESNDDSSCDGTRGTNRNDDDTTAASDQEWSQWVQQLPSQCRKLAEAMQADRGVVWSGRMAWQAYRDTMQAAPPVVEAGDDDGALVTRAVGLVHRIEWANNRGYFGQFVCCYAYATLVLELEARKMPDMVTFLGATLDEVAERGGWTRKEVERRVLLGKKVLAATGGHVGLIPFLPFEERPNSNVTVQRHIYSSTLASLRLMEPRMRSNEGMEKICNMGQRMIAGMLGGSETEWPNALKGWILEGNPPDLTAESSGEMTYFDGLDSVGGCTCGASASSV